MTLYYARCAELVHGALGDSTVKMALGQLKLPQHDKARRIVWVPRRGRIEKPDRRTGGKMLDEPARSTPLVVRWETVEAYVSAENDDTLEALLNNLLRAAYKAFGTDVGFGGYVLQTEQPQGQQAGASHLNWYHRYLVEFTFRLLVLEEIAPLTTITAVTHDATFNGIEADC